MLIINFIAVLIRSRFGYVALIFCFSISGFLKAFDNPNTASFAAGFFAATDGAAGAFVSSFGAAGFFAATAGAAGAFVSSFGAG